MNKRCSSFEDIKKLETIANCDYDFKNNRLIYTLNYYDEDKKQKSSKIIIKDIDSNEERLITAGGVAESNGRLSLDGSKVLFLSEDKYGRQLYVMDLQTGECDRLTTMRNGLMDPIWSPDGKKILFGSMGDANKSASYYTDLKQGDNIEVISNRPVATEDLGYKFDGLGFQQPENLHLWVVDMESKDVTRLTDGKYNYLHHTWSPDSTKVLCVSTRFRPKKDAIAYDLIEIDIDETNTMRRVTDGAWAVSYPNPVRPVYTSDGKCIIMGFLKEEACSSEMNTTGYPSIHLRRIAVDGTDEEILTQETEVCYDTVQFAYNPACGAGMEKLQVDDEYTYFLSGWEGKTRIYRVNIYGDKHEIEVVADGTFAINGMGKPSENKILISRSDTHCPEGYYLLDIKTGETSCLLQSNDKLISEVAFSSADDFSVKTLDGESKIHGWVLPPQNKEDGKKYPCILYIHGGPHPFYTYGFTHEFQAFAGSGYGIIYCNPRGSSGYGNVHRNLERANDGSAYTDLLQFADEACRRYNWIDNDQIGATGGSYGGLMTGWLAIKSSRFKAYIAQRMAASEMISYASSDMQGDSSKYSNFEEFMIHLLKESPIAYAEKVNAPILILHGMDDLRTPVEGAHQFYVALKDLHPDLPVKMVIYPKTAHNQPRHSKQLDHYYKQMLNWFNKYLLNVK